MAGVITIMIGKLQAVVGISSGTITIAVIFSPWSDTYTHSHVDATDWTPLNAEIRMDGVFWHKNLATLHTLKRFSE